MAFINKDDRFKIALASVVAWLTLQILGRTARIREIGKNHYLNLEARGENYIFTLWHGRMFIPIFVQRGRRIVAMVSAHTDGEIIARAVEMMGYQTVRGSSSKGGGKALRDMVKIMRGQGVPGAMMPDGPRGPKGDYKTGTITLAQLTEAYLVPMTHAADPAWTSKSWDRFLIAKPFARVVIAYGEPVKPPRKLDGTEMEALKKKMELRMDALVDEAENYLHNRWK